MTSFLRSVAATTPLPSSRALMAFRSTPCAMCFISGPPIPGFNGDPPAIPRLGSKGIDEARAYDVTAAAKELSYPTPR
ncbi:hypothetical protein FKP32DRAFT_1396616 [Trametes sanguinea]|nr:hypothetical protein FKP32DRAFT_1396616 [Trametes sanguinea]